MRRRTKQNMNTNFEKTKVNETQRVYTTITNYGLTNSHYLSNRLKTIPVSHAHLSQDV